MQKALTESTVSAILPRKIYKTAVHGILLHHTRQLLLSGFTHAPLILSYEIIFYKHTAASLPDYLFAGRSSRINMGIIPIQSAASPLKFSWDSCLPCRISGRLTDQYMGIYLHFHNPDGGCHAGTCHLFVNLMILNIQLCMGPLPPLVGGSDE